MLLKDGHTISILLNKNPKNWIVFIWKTLCITLWRSLQKKRKLIDYRGSSANDWELFHTKTWSG